MLKKISKIKNLIKVFISGFFCHIYNLCVIIYEYDTKK